MSMDGDIMDSFEHLRGLEKALGIGRRLMFIDKTDDKMRNLKIMIKARTKAIKKKEREGDVQLEDLRQDLIDTEQLMENSEKAVLDDVKKFVQKYNRTPILEMDLKGNPPTITVGFEGQGRWGSVKGRKQYSLWRHGGAGPNVEWLSKLAPTLLSFPTLKDLSKVFQ